MTKLRARDGHLLIIVISIKKIVFFLLLFLFINTFFYLQTYISKNSIQHSLQKKK